MRLIQFFLLVIMYLSSFRNQVVFALFYSQFTPASSKSVAAASKDAMGVTVTTYPKMESFVPSYVQGHAMPAPFPGNVQYPCNSDLQYSQQPYEMPMMAPESSAVTVSSPHEQPYVCQANEQVGSFSAELKSSGEPNVKTYADLSNGQTEIISVPTNLS